jgi:hypothetical protein
MTCYKQGSKIRRLYSGIKPSLCCLYKAYTQERRQVGDVGRDEETVWICKVISSQQGSTLSPRQRSIAPIGVASIYFLSNLDVGLALTVHPTSARCKHKVVASGHKGNPTLLRVRWHSNHRNF